MTKKTDKHQKLNAKMLPSAEFEKQDGINLIANQPYWSISGRFINDPDQSTNKLAIHWDVYQNTGCCRPYNLKDVPAMANDQRPYASLTYLPEIDKHQEPIIENNNRTYRLNASDTHLFVLDIEPYCNSKMRQELLDTLPFLYGERSQHGGYHLLIHVDDDLADKYQDLLNKTVIKGPLDPDKSVMDPKNEPQYECILNNHFITFTRCPLKLKPKLSHAELHQNLDKFLQEMKDNLPKYVYDDSDVDLHKLDIKNPNITEFVKRLLANDEIANELHYRVDQRITLANSNNDNSRYEYRCACSISWFLITQFKFILENLMCDCAPDEYFNHDEDNDDETATNDDQTDDENEELQPISSRDLRQLLNDVYGPLLRVDTRLWLPNLDDPEAVKTRHQNIVLCTAALMEKLLVGKRTKHKNKWNTTRDGLPWLIWTAQQAYRSGLYCGAEDKLRDVESLYLD